MRKALRSQLEGLGSKLPWNHITDQIGMFCYTGLSEEQVLKMRKDFNVFCTNDGRISIAGITTSNVVHIASAIHGVTK
jgi:aspartate aminotransferase, mitochondrial